MTALSDRIERLAAWKGRWGTAFRLMTFGRAEVVKSRHEPLPDLAWPGLCGIDGAPFDDPALHPRPWWRKRIAPVRDGGGMAAQKAGWR